MIVATLFGEEVVPDRVHADPLFDPAAEPEPPRCAACGRRGEGTHCRTCRARGIDPADLPGAT